MSGGGKGGGGEGRGETTRALSFEYLDWKGRRGGWRFAGKRRGAVGLTEVGEAPGATWGRLIAFSVKFMRSEPIRWEIRVGQKPEKGEKRSAVRRGRKRGRRTKR